MTDRTAKHPTGPLRRRKDGRLDLPCSCGHGWGTHNQYGCCERDGGIAGHDTYCSCGNQPPQMVADEKEARRVKRLGKCSKHPRYLIRTQPKSACATCWKAWFEVEGK